MRLLLSAVLLGGMGRGVSAGAAQTSSATETLLQRATALERSGRLDSAVLTWQQVLLIDPENRKAEEGLARSAKRARPPDRVESRKSPGSGVPAAERGESEQSRTKNREAGRSEAGRSEAGRSEAGRSETGSTQRHRDLDYAAQLAAQGQYSQAMKIYRAMLGAMPPPGDLALAYYETEAALDDARPHAIAGLRGLVGRYPEDARYRIALGRVLTYEPKTRGEGRRLLERYPEDAKAVEALRQSLVWDVGNPASALDLRAYLAKHPDPQLVEGLGQKTVAFEDGSQESAQKSSQESAQKSSQETAQESAPTHAGPSRVPQRSAGYRSMEQSAYRELATGHPTEAERSFRTILARRPHDGASLAGMGYLQMRQGNYEGAISFLVRAQHVGVEDAGLATALDTARFRSALGEAQRALAGNDLTTAETRFRAAAVLRPESPEALEGLGRTLVRKRQPDAAVSWFTRLTRAQPGSPAAWMQLVSAQEQAGRDEAALATERAMPSEVREKLMREPEFLNVLVSAYTDAGREAEAQQTLQRALDLPFPPGGRGIGPEKQLQYAALLRQAKRFDQADGLYREVLAVDGANLTAWKGLLEAEVAAGRKDQARATLTGMPAPVYSSAMREPGFDVAVAAVLMANGQVGGAEEVLDESIAQKSGEESWVSLGARVQLARIYLARGNPTLAYPVAQKALAGQPDAPAAWEVLLASLHASGRDSEALVLVEQLSPAVRTRLEGRAESLATLAAIYRVMGQTAQAGALLARLRTLDLTQHVRPPVEAEIEEARTLLRGGDEPKLYRQLVALDGRTDTTGEQRQVVQTLWAEWAVRRANEAAAGGDRPRAAVLLDAAARSFPENHAALLAVAGAYTSAGQPRRAVVLYQRTGLAGTTVDDYTGALTAALAANNLPMADSWLREALAANPHDARVLLLAAKVEQARGAPDRAAEFYRASLSATPSAAGEGASGRVADHPIEPVGLAVLLAPTAAVGKVDAAPSVAVLEMESRTAAREPVPRLRNYVPVYAESGGVAGQPKSSMLVRVP